jgi:hypothetical protein
MVRRRGGAVGVEEHGAHSLRLRSKAEERSFYVWLALLRRLTWHLLSARYHDAAEKLRVGIRDVMFLVGSFPPALPSWVAQ